VQLDVSPAAIESQIHCDAKGPGVKAASALKAFDALNYFDKRILRKFRCIVGIRADFEDYIVDAVLVFEDEAFDGGVVTATASLNQDGVINGDSGTGRTLAVDIHIWGFCHGRFPCADWGRQVPTKKSARHQAERANMMADSRGPVNLFRRAWDAQNPVIMRVRECLETGDSRLIIDD
jgi:hypothetical protein